ncbi:glycosyltransferase family 2 protein [Rhodopirellula europaea]|uniref:glycosyltransferase family 2 protein n=1 Tax=Rhodopirellula europaea TaxID=1263866 RepID=UPI0005868B7B|nr:glycosyltransferase family 2 protein [Rhodopirellula europaea]
MRNLSNIPRLSIVVPHGGDGAAFESSLASVLQHRPDGCEVIVPHDGTYDDPFDLGEEVRFVDSGSTSVLRQISEAAELAMGRFVHVVADGHVATENWTDAALAQFEGHETGVVVPVVRDSETQRIEHAGWRTTASSACGPIGFGDKQVARKAAARVEGAFLAASFWRRDLLRSLAISYRGTDTIEASLAYGHLTTQAGWRCVVAEDSVMSIDFETEVLDYDLRIHQNHRRLQAISDHFRGGGSAGWGRGIQRLLTTTLAGGLRPSSLISGLRRMTAPLAGNAISRSVQTSGVLSVDDNPETLPMTSVHREPLRRAA